MGKDKFSEVDNTAFRSKIGYVTQDPSIIQGSLSDNISFESTKKINESKNIKYYMNLAGIANLFERKDQNVYEAGKNYSGGQSKEQLQENYLENQKF